MTAEDWTTTPSSCDASAVIDRHYRKNLRAVVADGERRANVHGALGGGRLVVILRLLVKINVGLIVVVFQEIRSLVQTDPAGGAGVIHVPGALDVFGKFVCFISHGKISTRKWVQRAMSFWWIERSVARCLVVAASPPLSCHRAAGALDPPALRYLGGGVGSMSWG